MSAAPPENTSSPLGRLRRDLGSVEAYAALIGMLVGAGIFQVTGDAYKLTGPSVILGYLVLAPAVLATSVAYCVYLSTPLGLTPGGEYTHLDQTFRTPWLAVWGAWLKLVSYLGASAYLALTVANYAVALAVACGLLSAEAAAQVERAPIALGCLAFFFAVNVSGVRWFGRAQVAMCAVLGVSILVLVVPGLFAVEEANYRPFFTAGTGGFMAALPPLFFAYAAFEALAHSAGEVKDSTVRLPRVFIRGIAATTVVYLAMSGVVFGVLPGAALQTSSAPMADAAAVYLPAAASALVAIGGVLAAATSLNATVVALPRLGLMLATDGHLPAWLARVHPRTATPVVGLVLATGIPAVLVGLDQIATCFRVAVLALATLYGLHSYALLRLPHRNPELFAQVTTTISRPIQVACAVASVAAMATLVGVLGYADVETITTQPWAERYRELDLTSLELCAAWSILGSVLYFIGRRRVSAGHAKG